MKTFFISDLHFGHTNVIKYEGRPFADADEMDKELVKRWNSVVGKNDIVWFLGDLCVGRNREYMKKLVPQLKGHKRMILGNHDQWSINTYYELGFEYVSKYPIILKNFFVLSHEPLEWMGKNSPFYYIYGHVHGAPAFQTETENSRCVCVERQNYTPIELEVFNKYQENQDWLKKRHDN